MKTEKSESKLLLVEEALLFLYLFVLFSGALGEHKGMVISQILAYP